MNDGVKQSARRSRLPLLFGDGGYNHGENDKTKGFKIPSRASASQQAWVGHAQRGGIVTTPPLSSGGFSKHALATATRYALKAQSTP
jgi:hypothetical protein